MQGYNFTERVRAVLAMAREDAARLHHEYVGTEHLLLALVREGEGVGANVLLSLNIDLDEVTRLVEETVLTGVAARGTTPDLPYTSRAKKVLELSMAAARDLDHSYVGTEHLLLGLVHEQKGIAAQVLTELGATDNDVQAATIRLCGTKMPDRQSMGSREGAPIVPVTSVSVQVRRSDGSVMREEFHSVAGAIEFLRSQ